MDNEASDSLVTRTRLAAMGTLGGAALWFLAERLRDIIGDGRLFLFVSAMLVAFFVTALAMAGPLRLRRAFAGAVIIALPAALLLTWGSGGFQMLKPYLQSGGPLLAFATLSLVPVPFYVAAQRPAEGWRNYPALFSHAWTLLVRYAAAWLFVALSFGVLWLSDLVLSIVGLRVIQDLLDLEAVPYLLAGLLLGLGLSVVDEYSDYISPFLLLRLLRLFVPFVLLVVLVFAVAVSLQGLGDMFWGYSTAGTLVTTVLAGVMLVTVALDRTDGDAAEGALLRLATRGLALVLPVLALAALYAIWLRVGQHGWTPGRVYGALAAGLAAVYAVTYAVAALDGRGWMARIRTVNIVMALVVLATAALTLTPFVNPERIATDSQIARYQAGQMPLEDLALWEMAEDWGDAGQAGLDRLEGRDGGAEAERLAILVARVRSAESRWSYEQMQDGGAAPEVSDLLALLPMRPAGAELPEGVFAGVPGTMLANWIAGCGRRSSSGEPGCVVMIADLHPARPGPEPVVIWRLPDRRIAHAVFVDAGEAWQMRGLADISAGPGGRPGGDPAMLEAVLDGSAHVEPAGLNALVAGPYRLVPSN